MHVIERTVSIAKTWAKSGISPEPIVVRRGEYGDTQLRITILGDNNTAYDLAGKTIHFCAKFAGEHWIRAAMRAEGSQAVYTVDTAFASMAGRAAVSYVEVKSSAGVLPTDTIPLYVLENADASGTELEEYKNTVDALLSELEKQKSAIDSKESEWDAAERSRADAEAKREEAEAGREDTVAKAEEAVSRADQAVSRADQAVDDAQTALNQIQEAYTTATGAAEAAKEAAGAIQGVTDDAVAATKAANDIADTLTQKLEAGDFKGDKGDPGDDAKIGDVTATVNTGSTEPKVSVTTQSHEGVVDLEFTFDGFKGDQGEPGDKGDPGKSAEIGEVTAIVGDGVGTPSVQVTQAATEEGIVDIKFDFQNLKGDQGDPGDKGDATNLRNVTASVNTLSSVPSVQVETTHNEDGTADLAFTFNGFKGDKGNAGDKANIGTVTAEVDPSSEGKNVTVETNPHDGVVDMNFKFGADFKGDKGEPGGVDEAAIKQILLRAYPVGSYYWSENKTSPEELFGGTWKAVEDRFIYAAKHSGSAGETGGVATVALSTSEMPSHTHTGPSHSHGLNSHTHSIPSHYHSGPSHSHTMSHKHSEQGFYTASNEKNMGLAEGSFFIGRTMVSGTTAEMQAKSGNYSLYTSTYSGSTGNGGTGNTGTWSGTSGQASGSTASGGTGNTGSAGSGAAHENMPPYVTAYCWKRTA